jgi:hypothetical protein
VRKGGIPAPELLSAMVEGVGILRSKPVSGGGERVEKKSAVRDVDDVDCAKTKKEIGRIQSSPGEGGGGGEGDSREETG